MGGPCQLRQGLSGSQLPPRLLEHGGLPQVIQGDTKVNLSELLALNIYSTYNINKNWHGVAQAKAVVFFILVAVLALTQQALTRKKEVQQ